MVSPSLLVEQNVVQSLAMRYARRVRQVYRGYVLENGAIWQAAPMSLRAMPASSAPISVPSGAHCWAFQAARMSAPVADHTPP